jgi:hypothetical protein
MEPVKLADGTAALVCIDCDVIGLEHEVARGGPMFGRRSRGRGSGSGKEATVDAQVGRTQPHPSLFSKPASS